MKVSVVMSVYGESLDQLNKAINSILKQSFQDFEFIIILDNPEAEEVNKYLLAISKENDKIIFLRNKNNLKLGASLNKAISVATGEYVARMDADDVCNSYRFQKQVQFLENNEHIDLLFTGWEEIDEKGNRTIRIPKNNNFINIHQTFFYKSPILHASMMCKREIFEKYSYPVIDRPEDFGLFIKLIKNKYKFGVIEENLYTYYVDMVDFNKKYIKIRVFSSNFLKILWKNKIGFLVNIYFWWMFLLVIIQWLLSRNKFIFRLFFNTLQIIYIKLFIENP